MCSERSRLPPSPHSLPHRHASIALVVHANGLVLNEVAGTGRDPSLSTSLAAVDSCHQETVLLEEVLGQLEGKMAQLGALHSCLNRSRVWPIVAWLGVMAQHDRCGLPPPYKCCGVASLNCA